MCYLVRARLREGSEQPLLDAIGDGSLGKGSVAGDEYFRDMETARLCADGTARWVETCFCSTPLQEERPYWEKYFELVKIQDSHDRRACRDCGTAKSPGPASIAIARRDWNSGWPRPARLF